MRRIQKPCSFTVILRERARGRESPALAVMASWVPVRSAPVKNRPRVTPLVLGSLLLGETLIHKDFFLGRVSIKERYSRVKRERALRRVLPSTLEDRHTADAPGLDSFFLMFWVCIWLITRRSLIQIQPPLPSNSKGYGFSGPRVFCHFLTMF